MNSHEIHENTCPSCGITIACLCHFRTSHDCPTCIEKKAQIKRENQQAQNVPNPESPV